MRLSYFVMRVVVFAILIFGAGNPSTSAAAYRTVIGGPEYIASTGIGFRDPSAGGGVNSAGTAVGSATKFSSGMNWGSRAVRWSETGVFELGNLGVDLSGATASQAYAINSSGLSAGYARQYIEGSYRGERAVRWDGSGTPTILDHIGLDSEGFTYASAYDVNESGTAVGEVGKFEGFYSTGSRAVRWDSGGTAATELGHLGLLPFGFTYAYAYAINDAGTIVGVSDKPSPTGTYGTRAVRWSAGSTVAIELGDLGTDLEGNTGTAAYDVNNQGMIVGIAFKHEAGTFVGQRAVRWEKGSNVATELETLGFDSNGVGLSYAADINELGTVVGTSRKHESGVDLGNRAVRWDNSTSTPFELGNLGTDSRGVTQVEVLGLNDNNLAVGNARKYVDGIRDDNTRAVLWLENGAAVDLNRFIDPASGWLLTDAQAISNTNWIKGIGLYDHDGTGTLLYARFFLIQIPEPGTWILALIMGSLAISQQRKR